MEQASRRPRQFQPSAGSSPRSRDKPQAAAVSANVCALDGRRARGPRRSMVRRRRVQWPKAQHAERPRRRRLHGRTRARRQTQRERPGQQDVGGDRRRRPAGRTARLPRKQEHGRMEARGGVRARSAMAAKFSNTMSAHTARHTTASARNPAPGW